MFRYRHAELKSQDFRYVWDKDMSHEWITIAFMILMFVVMDRVDVGLVMVALSMVAET